MNLTQEQILYIKEHLIDIDKTYAIAAIAKKMVECNKYLNIDSEEIQIAALVMNIGETNEQMIVNDVSIYSKEYGKWDETAKKLNSERGQRSVEMALEQGIQLSDDMQQAIISTSKGGSLNGMAITLKLAQTMEAIKHTRWSRGEKKEPAQDITEVTNILREELDFMLKGQEIDEVTKNEITQSMLQSAREVYLSEKQNSIRKSINSVIKSEDQAVDEESIKIDGENPKLTRERIDKLLSSIPVEKIDELSNELQQIISTSDEVVQIEDSIYGLVEKWEENIIVQEHDKSDE